MRIHILLIFLAGLLSTANVLAQQEKDEHAGHHPDQQSEEAGASSAGQGEDSVHALARNMKKIQELMKQIHAASDAAEREALMDEHLRAMRDQMRMVLSMGAGMGMKGGGMGAMGKGKDEKKPADAKGGGMMGGGMMKMHKQMESRMRMLEMMLEQTIEREAVEAGVEQED